MQTPDAPRSPTRAFTEAMAGGEEKLERPTPAAAFSRARAIFRAGGRIDMGALATETGVARATLYRWTGDRDRLLADLVIAELGELISGLDRTTRGSGPERLARVAARFHTTVADNPMLHRLLEHEGDHGLNLLTSPDGLVRPRIVGLVTDLIQREAEERGYKPPADPALLADAMVALGERFLYHSGGPQTKPDPTQLAFGLLLREK
jgi:AcrR family transcriptional regulator